MKNFGVHYATFQQEIQAGKLNKAGTMFVGEKENVTDEVLYAVSEFIRAQGNQAITFDRTGTILWLRVIKSEDSDHFTTKNIEETAIRVHEFSREQWNSLPDDQKLVYTREIKRVLMTYEGVLNATDITEEPEHG